MSRIWITFRTENGTKFFGQIEDHSFEKLGKANVDVYHPMSSFTAVEKGVVEGARNITTRIQPLLEPNDYDDDFQIYNSTRFVCWQKVTGERTVANLEEIVRRISEKRETENKEEENKEQTI